jgi:hypothetical protein
VRDYTIKIKLNRLKGNPIHYTRTSTQPPTNFSNMSTILKLNIFDASNLIASAPKPMGNMGGKSISVNYKVPEGQSPITIQTSWMRSFGINKWLNPNDESAPAKLSVTLSFQGVETDAKINELKDVLQGIDEWAIDTAHKNSWEWLKTKSAPRDTIAFNYTRSFKFPVDKETGEPNGKPATMKIKLDRARDSDDYTATFFNKDRTLITSADVESVFTMGSKVRALIQCTGFWVAAGKFGLSWRLKQMIVDPSSRIGKEYAFDDDAEESAPAAVVAPAPKKAAPVPVAEISNSDDEEEAAPEEAAPEPVVQEQEPEPEPTQAKKVVRKVITKK